MSDKAIKERWLPCSEPEYKHYLVSDRGRVMNSKTGWIVKPHAKNSYERYLKYELWSGGKRKIFYSHRLVWQAFCGDIPCGLEVDHVDNNAANNRLDNLQLLTHRENTKKRGGGWKHGQGKRRNRPKAKRPTSEETKAKLRAKTKAYNDARKAEMIEP